MKAFRTDGQLCARNELSRLLAALPEIKMVAEAANAKQAREQFAALWPDLSLLDVQMPGGDRNRINRFARRARAARDFYRGQ